MLTVVELLEKLLIISYVLKNNSWSPEVSVPGRPGSFKGPSVHSCKAFQCANKRLAPALLWAGLPLRAGVIYLPATQRYPTAPCRAPGCLGERPAGSKTQRQLRLSFLC